jgi:hypothetical protein
LLSRGESFSQICISHAQFDLTSGPEITPVTLDPPEIKVQRTIHEAASLPEPSADSSIQIPSSCANIESYLQITKRIREKEATKERIAAGEEHQKTQRFLNRDGKKLNLSVEELISKSDGYFQET